MAAPTLVETFKVLRDSEEWLNALEIAFTSNKGERACREAARQLTDIGVVRVKLIDKRQFFKMTRLTREQKKLPLIVDINETIKIKESKDANISDQDYPREGKTLPGTK